MDSKRQERIKAQFVAVISSVIEFSHDLLFELETLRDMGGLDDKNASSILKQAIHVSNSNAIYYLLKTIDGEFKLDGAFENYFRIKGGSDSKDKQSRLITLYKLALKTRDAKYVGILHDKLGYSKVLAKDSLKICVQVAQQNFEKFLDLISNGELLSGQECSWGYRAQQKMDLESWKKLQKFHEVLACHPSVLANESAKTELDRDIELATTNIRNLIKEKVREELFLATPKSEEVSNVLRTLSSTSLSGQDPAGTSLSDEIDGSKIKITKELLRSRMDDLGKPVEKGYYSTKQR